MQIINGSVLYGKTNRFEKLNININNGKIESFDKNACDEDIYNAEGLFVIPGFVDTHIHGYVAVEFASDDEDFTRARQCLAKEGVTAFAATVRSMTMDRILAAERNILREARRPCPDGAKVMAINLEGPFISSTKSGVLQPPPIECHPDAIRTLAEAGEGMLKIMTLAPERENMADSVKTAVECGVKVSIGHTDATYDQAESAINAGATRATHVFNAMRPFSHRETGVLGAVLTDDRVNCELICDLVHLDRPAIDLVHRAKGFENITLISDGGYMSGLGDGEYIVDGKVRTVKDGICRNDSGRIAGSCVSMLVGAKTLLAMGIPMEEISVMASANPAKAIDAFRDIGSIEKGKYADLIVCDKDFNIKAVFINGKKV